MNANEISLLIRVIRQHYELGYSQTQIAEMEHLSKSAVNRIIKKAKANHYIEYKLNYPARSCADLEARVADCFGIEKVCIAPTTIDNMSLRLADVCRMLAADVNMYIRDKDVIGVTWGQTIECLASCLSPIVPAKKGIRVVQMGGSLARAVSSSVSSGIVGRFMENYMAEGFLMPAPLIVDSANIARALMEDSQIRSVASLSAHAHIMLMSIGSMRGASTILARGAMQQTDHDHLLSLGAVGDLAGHYVTIEGNLADPEMDERVIAVRLEDIAQGVHRNAVAVGEHKAPAIVGALRTGVVGTFYTDEATANEVLRVQARHSVAEW